MKNNLCLDPKLRLNWLKLRYAIASRIELDLKIWPLALQSLIFTWSVKGVVQRTWFMLWKKFAIRFRVVKLAYLCEYGLKED